MKHEVKNPIFYYSIRYDGGISWQIHGYLHFLIHPIIHCYTTYIVERCHVISKCQLQKKCQHHTANSYCGRMFFVQHKNKSLSIHFKDMVTSVPITMAWHILRLWVEDMDTRHGGWLWIYWICSSR